MLMILGFFSALVAGAAADTILSARAPSEDDETDDRALDDDSGDDQVLQAEQDAVFAAFDDAIADHDLLAERIHSSDTYPAAPPPEPVTAVASAAQSALDGGALNDLLGAADVPAYLAGHGGQDVLYATTHAAHMIGGEGDDVMVGGAGDDRIEGCDGDDWIAAGAGTNTLLGGAGDDVLLGLSPNAQGDDVGGQSFLNGGDGDDLLIAGGGDYMNGGNGNDVFVLGDWLHGHDAATLVDFDSHDDQILLHFDPARLPDPQVVVTFAQDDPETAQIWVAGHLVAQVANAPDLTPDDIGLVPNAGPGLFAA